MKTICTGMFTIMLIFLFRPVGAQTEDAFPSYIEQCFNNYFNFNPQEKIYLHTDKPTYSAGENIWFRAYCVDASYHIPTQLSKFIYLELINRQDSILKRIQIKQTDSCFYGNLTIPSTTLRESIACVSLPTGCKITKKIFSSKKIYRSSVQ